MPHHTKDKGDLGVAKVHADLVAQGFIVLLPLTEHAPFDLVAYRDCGFVRVQVKYRSLRSGKVKVEFKSSWTDRNGTHKRPIDKSEVDVVAIYCPQTDECYYVDPTGYRREVSLRILPSRNNQSMGVHIASSLREMTPRERGGQGSLLSEDA